MIKHHNKKQIHISKLLAIFILVFAVIVQMIPLNRASALQITSRSLTLMSGVAHGTPNSIDGGASPGGNVRHRFAFTLPSAGNLLSIKFRYCTLPGANGDACIRPTDLDLSGINETADIEVQTINGTAGGFTLQSPAPTNSDDSFYITRGSGTNSADDPIIVQVKDVINPSTINTTFFVRISTYTTADASGTPVDYGVVAASTSRDIVLTGTMPESLVFCAAETVGETANVPDCATKAGDGDVSFDRLFSPSDTAFATSQFAASTNAGTGYAVSVMGPTLTSGTNTITAMSTGGTSAHGVSQFGLNVVANYTGTEDPEIPTLGANVTTPTGGSTYHGQPATNYGTENNFRFVPTSNYTGSNETEITQSGENIANSNSLGSDAQVFTVSYIVNVPGSQPAGAYTTTLTYVCTASF